MFCQTIEKKRKMVKRNTFGVGLLKTRMDLITEFIHFALMKASIE